MLSTLDEFIKFEAGAAFRQPIWWAGERFVLAIGNVRLQGSAAFKGFDVRGLSSYLTTHRFVWKKSDGPPASGICFSPAGLYSSFDRRSATGSTHTAPNFATASSDDSGEPPSAVDAIIWSYFELQKAVRILAIESPLRTKKVAVMFGTNGSGKKREVKIRTSRDAFSKTYSKMLEVHSSEAWKAAPPPAPADDPLVMSSGVGVVRHMDRHRTRALHRSDAVSSISADLRLLQTNAESLVTIARQLRQTTKYNNPETESITRLLNEFGLSDTDVQFDEKDSYFCNVANTLKVLLVKVLPPDLTTPSKSVFDNITGNPNDITGNRNNTTGNNSGTYNNKASPLSSSVRPGSDLYSSTANQKLGSMNGTMLVHELYCLYCRVPGAPIVSPADFLAAVKNVTSSEQCPHMYREFREGAVKAVQLRSMTDEAVANRLVNLIQEFETQAATGNTDLPWRGISANQLAKTFECSVTLALSQLKMTEARSLLCRDESWEGLYFYRNLISSHFNQMRMTSSRL